MKFTYKVVLGFIFSILLVVAFLKRLQPAPAPLPVPQPKQEQHAQEVKPPTLFYGMVVDSLAIVRNTVKKGQRLADLFAPYQVQGQAVYNLSRNSKAVFDVRKLRVNKPYDVVVTKDSLPVAKALVYYHNNIDYVIFHVDDTVFVEKGRKPVATVEKTASGVIQNSLAATITQMGLSPMLTNELADVFAWQIDFFRLYPGDRFKVIYEEQRVDDKSIGISLIKAAVFEHNGYENYAYYFKQNSKTDYFDEDGKSLRKAFLKYPVKFSRISSRYSGNRYHPVLKRYKAHRGTDFAAPKGTPIRAVGDGVVVAAQFGKNNGNYVKIRHNSIYTTQYLHMSKIASGMKPGTHVKQGQTIGYVGATGLATGNHVCYRFWKNGYQVDALQVKLPSSEPIKPELMPAYKLAKAQLKAKLDNIAYPPKATTAAIMGGAR